MDLILDPSLVLYLPLYELDGASFMPRDAYGHLCTVTGALWTPRGRSFDGIDDYIACGSAPSLSNTLSLSIEAWIRGNETGRTQRIVNGGPAWFDQRILNSNQFQIEILNGAAWVAVNGGAFAKDMWYHLVSTYNDANDAVALYVDGNIIKTGTIVAAQRAGRVDIGGFQAGEYFNGRISEVRIYAKALTPVEVISKYLATEWRYK